MSLFGWNSRCVNPVRLAGSLSLRWGGISVSATTVMIQLSTSIARPFPHVLNSFEPVQDSKVLQAFDAVEGGAVRKGKRENPEVRPRLCSLRVPGQKRETDLWSCPNAQSCPRRRRSFSAMTVVLEDLDYSRTIVSISRWPGGRIEGERVGRCCSRR